MPPKGSKKSWTKIKCAYCEKEFEIRNCYLKREQIHCCSTSCAYYYRLYNPQDSMGTQRRSGPIKNTLNWYIDKLGYIYFSRGVHKGKRAHRVVMEKFLGRSLLKAETVHHKDLNKLNNRISNLEIMSISEHRKLHSKLAIMEKRASMIIDADSRSAT